MYYRNAKETVIIESIERLSQKGGINSVSRNYSNSASHWVSILMFLNFLNLHQYIRKAPSIAYQITVTSVTSAKFLKVLYITVFKVFVKHLSFWLKTNSASAKKETQIWQL